MERRHFLVEANMAERMQQRRLRDTRQAFAKIITRAWSLQGVGSDLLEPREHDASGGGNASANGNAKYPART